MAWRSVEYIRGKNWKLSGRREKNEWGTSTTLASNKDCNSSPASYEYSCCS